MNPPKERTIVHRRPKGSRRVAIVGTGSYVPERVLTNFDLEKMVDTTDEWIFTRSGIRERRIARPDEASSDMGAIAARRALEAAGTAPEEVDMIVVATITPDMLFPNTACFVQNLIRARNAFCFDLEAACCGFLYSMEVAEQFISSGAVRTALVIAADKLSAVTDWTDRSTCVLFGDGAGAAVLRAVEDGSGIINTVMGSDGSLTGLLQLPGGGSRTPASPESVERKLHCMKMEGREVFKHAVKAMSDAAQEVLKRAGLTVDDVDCLIPHQANTRIIQAIGERLGIPIGKTFMNLEKYGNMSGASIPVALDEAVRGGRVRKGDIVLLVAFGGGFTWSASLLHW